MGPREPAAGDEIFQIGFHTISYHSQYFSPYQAPGASKTSHATLTNHGLPRRRLWHSFAQKPDETKERAPCPRLPMLPMLKLRYRGLLHRWVRQCGVGTEVPISFSISFIHHAASPRARLPRLNVLARCLDQPRPFRVREQHSRGCPHTPCFLSPTVASAFARSTPHIPRATSFLPRSSPARVCPTRSSSTAMPCARAVLSCLPAFPASPLCCRGPPFRRALVAFPPPLLHAPMRLHAGSRLCARRRIILRAPRCLVLRSACTLPPLRAARPRFVCRAASRPCLRLHRPLHAPPLLRCG